MSGLEAFGWLGLFGGIGGVFYSFGRSGPKGQTSCCGCSCLVLVLALPAGALLIWQSGGPLLAAAAVPLAIPFVWCLDAAATLGWAIKESFKVLRLASR